MVAPLDPSGSLGRSNSAPRAPDSHVSQQRCRSPGAARAGAGEGGDTEVMRRRDFVRAIGRGAGGLAVGWSLFGFRPPAGLPASASLLIPLDDAQTDHLNAYGLAYRAVQAGLKAE